MPLPYLLLAIALPSKDVLSVALFMLFFSLMARERLFVAAVVGAGTFLIRDGASVMLLSTLVAWLVVRKRPRLAVAASVGVLGFAIIVSTAAESLFSDLFIFARQLTALEGIAESRLGLYEQGGAALRLVGNLTNLAFRPAVLDAHGGVALIGVAYWICGIALLYAFAAAAAFVWHRRSDMEVMAGLLFFVSLGVLVVSPWIQPRYLFPAAAVVLLVHRHTRLAFTPATAWVTCTLAAIAGAVLYGASPVGLPSAVDVARWSPFWLF
jgi:hypothetical protein